MGPKITMFRIFGTDVILQDYEDGKGKLILSNVDRDHNVSYYWGSMGQGYDLSKFILQTNNGYLISKLGERSGDGPINIKKTMANVRNFIKNDSPWKFYYSPMSDKELRSDLNHIQKYTQDDRDFVDRMQQLDPCYDDSDDMYNRGEYYFDDTIQMLKTEPWHFIVRHSPDVNKWLSIFLPKLRLKLNEKEAIDEN